jgi:hypothetical protein
MDEYTKQSRENSRAAWAMARDRDGRNGLDKSKLSKPIQDELPEFKLSGNDGFKAPSESIAQTLGVSSRALESFIVDTYARHTDPQQNDTQIQSTSSDAFMMQTDMYGSMDTTPELQGRIDALESLVNQINTAVGLPQPSTTPIDLSGETLRELANELGKNDDIRFERLADGTYQQYIDGSKGEVFTEETLREHTEDREAEKAKDAEKENVSDSGLPVASHRSGEIRIPGITPFNVYTKISQHNSGSLSLRVNVSNLTITSSSFVAEYAPGELEDMVVFSGDDQTQFTIPLARKSGGTWIVESEGGIYILPVLCVNGKPAIFPVRVC